jgi:hypothetical protein
MIELKEFEKPYGEKVLFFCSSFFEGIPNKNNDEIQSPSKGEIRRKPARSPKERTDSSIPTNPDSLNADSYAILLFLDRELSYIPERGSLRPGRLTPA